MATINARKQQGFTLVELVMVIILLAIVGTFSSQFIATNVTLFQQSVNQNERLNDARFVINRINKEFDAAMAFSVRESGGCIRFIPFNAAGRYLGLAASQSNIKLIMDADTRENGIGTFTGQRLGIYNTIYNDFVTAPAIFTYQASGGTSTTHADLTLVESGTTNAKAISVDSPASRYFIFSREVSYCLEGDSLFRYDDALNTNPPSGSKVLMMERLSADSSMNLTTTGAFSNAMLELDFGFILRDASIIRFQHQVVMNNVP